MDGPADTLGSSLQQRHQQLERKFEDIKEKLEEEIEQRKLDNLNSNKEAEDNRLIQMALTNLCKKFENDHKEEVDKLIISNSQQLAEKSLELDATKSALRLLQSQLARQEKELQSKAAIIDKINGEAKKAQKDLQERTEEVGKLQVRISNLEKKYWEQTFKTQQEAMEGQQVREELLQQIENQQGEMSTLIEKVLQLEKLHNETINTPDAMNNEFTIEDTEETVAGIDLNAQFGVENFLDAEAPDTDDPGMELMNHPTVGTTDTTLASKTSVGNEANRIEAVCYPFLVTDNSDDQLFHFSSSGICEFNRGLEESESNDDEEMGSDDDDSRDDDAGVNDGEFEEDGGQVRPLKRKLSEQDQSSLVISKLQKSQQWELSSAAGQGSKPEQSQPGSSTIADDSTPRSS